jgi:hypothetical protein
MLTMPVTLVRNLRSATVLQNKTSYEKATRDLLRIRGLVSEFVSGVTVRVNV